MHLYQKRLVTILKNIATPDEALSELSLIEQEVLSTGDWALIDEFLATKMILLMEMNLTEESASTALERLHITDKARRKSYHHTILVIDYLRCRHSLGQNVSCRDLINIPGWELLKGEAVAVVVLQELVGRNINISECEPAFKLAEWVKDTLHVNDDVAAPSFLPAATAAYLALFNSRDTPT